MIGRSELMYVFEDELERRIEKVRLGNSTSYTLATLAVASGCSPATIRMTANKLAKVLSPEELAVWNRFKERWRKKARRISDLVREA